MTKDIKDNPWLPIIARFMEELEHATNAESLFHVLADTLLKTTGAMVAEIDLLSGPQSALSPVLSLNSDGSPSALRLASNHTEFAHSVAQQPHLITRTFVAEHDGIDQESGVLAGLPLAHTQTEGVVLLAFHKNARLDAKLQQVIELFVHQTARHLHQVRISAEEQKKTSHLALLNTIGELARGQHPTHLIVEQILNAILVTFKLDTIVIYSGSPMIVSHVAGDHVPAMETILGAGLARIALEEGYTLLSNDLEHDQRCIMPKWTSQRWYTEIAAPIEMEGQYIGVLDAYCARPEHLDMLDLQTFSTLSGQLGAVLRKERTSRLAADSTTTSTLSLPVLNDAAATTSLAHGLASLAEAIGADHAVLFSLHDHMLQESLKWPAENRPLGQSVDNTATFGLAQECLAFHKPLIAGRVNGLNWATSSTRPDTKRGAYLAIPLGHSREETGVVVLIFNSPPRLSAEQQHTLDALLAMLTALVQGAYHSEQINQQRQQYALLYTIAANTHTLASPLEVIMETAETMRTSMQWQIVEVYQWDTSHHRFSKLGSTHNSTVVRPNQDAMFEQVRRSMEPVIWNPKGTRPLGELYTHSAEMAAPMIQKGKLRGLIYVKGSAKQRFSPLDAQFLHRVANLLGDTLNNIAVYARLRQQLQESLTLNQIYKNINYSADLEIILQRIIETVARTMRCYGAHIAMLADDRNALIVHAQTGFARSQTLPEKYVLRSSLLGQVAQSQKQLSLTDVRALSDSLYVIPEVQSILASPLINASQETIGVLAVASDQTAAFSRTDEHLLDVAASQISMVIQNKQLYQDLELRGDRLKQAYQKLQDFTELKEQILQNVSHELRTPLTMVKGYVDLMSAEELGPLNEKQRQALDTIVTRTDDMVDIIKQVVAVRPLGETDTQFTAIEADRLLSDIVAFITYRKGNSDTSISLNHIDPELCFYGDAEKIRHICVNLLDNAVKFSPGGGQIKVAAIEDGFYVHLTISDQGIGIPDQKINRIFETFYQVDGSSTRAFGGLGLGLTAVHNLVQQLSGKIWVDSEVNKGSTFHVQLPRAEKGVCVIPPDN